VIEDPSGDAAPGPTVCITRFAAGLQQLLARPARRAQIWTDDLRRARAILAACRADVLALGPDEPRLPLPADTAYRHWARLANPRGMEQSYES